MNFAVLSDIHSNVFALKAVIDPLVRTQPDGIFILGDFYGYYPWAAECAKLIEGLCKDFKVTAILGNHDALVLQDTLPGKKYVYWDAARSNREDLELRHPQGLAFLSGLPIKKEMHLDSWNVKCFHGTPDEPLEGRYYPDDETRPAWLPGSHELILLGQTHYPLIRRTAAGGVIFNPGSVGQSRDGDPRASWGRFDLKKDHFEICRVEYPIESATETLNKMGWNKQFTAALSKKSTLIN